MPRRSSSRSSGSRYSTGYKSTPTKPAPTHNPNPTQTQSKGGIFSGLGQTLKHGLAFGAGSQIAHQAIRSVVGPSHHQVQSPMPQNQMKQNQNLCTNEMQNLNICIKSSSNDISICQPYVDLLKQCKQSGL